MISLKKTKRTEMTRLQFSAFNKNKNILNSSNSSEHVRRTF
jgi:hypothetical protein